MANWKVVVFGISVLLCQVSSESSIYDNYTLFRLFPKNANQQISVSQFKDPDGQIEVLKSSRGINDSLDVLVPPNKVEFIEDYAQDANILLEVKEANYGRTLDAVERTPRRRVFNGFNVFEYHSFSAISDYLESLAKKKSNLVTLQPLGQTYEGRRVKLVKISTNPDAGNPIIFVDAGIHAREWVAPAMALYMIHRLTNDPDAKLKELNGVDWYILPVVNPDGYEFTRTSKSSRLWRKTRSKNANCYGVDGNRNYGFKWAVSGVSNDPCNMETYAGPKPFSESETRMVRNVMMENSKRMKLYVSLHSYGQYLVYPWGYTGDYLPRTWHKLDSLARAVSDAVQRAGGKPFRVLSAGKWYPAAGGSDDFAFGAVGVPYSYTMELTDGYEFLYPEYLLRQVLPQFYEGFKAFGGHIRNEFRRVRTKSKSEP